jgi:hypothetical protein
MSLLGQLAGRIDRNLTLVNELTKALIALRAQLLGKTESLKLTAEAVQKAGQTVAAFLEGLVLELDLRTEGEKAQATTPTPSSEADQRVQVQEEYQVIRRRLLDAGQQPADWAADFREMILPLRSNNPLRAEQLDKVSEVVGYLQGDVAEDVRRLRTR